MPTLLTHAHIISPGREIRGGAILIGERKIAAVPLFLQNVLHGSPVFAVL